MFLILFTHLGLKSLPNLWLLYASHKVRFTRHRVEVKWSLIFEYNWLKVQHSVNPYYNAKFSFLMYFFAICYVFVYEISPILMFLTIYKQSIILDIVRQLHHT